MLRKIGSMSAERPGVWSVAVLSALLQYLMSTMPTVTPVWVMTTWPLSAGTVSLTGAASDGLSRRWYPFLMTLKNSPRWFASNSCVWPAGNRWPWNSGDPSVSVTFSEPLKSPPLFPLANVRSIGMITPCAVDRRF